MTIEEIKVFLTEHKNEAEVKAFLTELSSEHVIAPDEVNEFLKTEDGKLLIQPFVDQAVTKAVKTRDKAHEVLVEVEVKKKVASEILKMNPAEEPWQKEIRELKEENEKERNERAKDVLKRQIVEEAMKMGVDPFFVDDFMPESLEVGKLYLQKIKARDKQLIEVKTNELLATGFKPGSAAVKRDVKQDLSKLTQAELIRLEMDGILDQQIAG